MNVRGMTQGIMVYYGTHFNLKFDFNLIEIEICFRDEIEMCAIVCHDPLRSSGSERVTGEELMEIPYQIRIFLRQRKKSARNRGC